MTDEELLQIIERAAREKAENLNLGNKGLTSIPAEIGKIRSLRALNLRNNNLTTLPAEIGQLKKLNTLYLYNNKLTELPVEIGGLNNLTALHINNNDITYLPKEIKGLLKLTSLVIDNNRLKELPVEIGNLTNLLTLSFSGNDISIPPEIVDGGCKKIIRFYKQKLEQKADKIYEAKLLIVGEGGAGKTTLAKKIQFSEYELQDEDTTQGIDILQWKFQLKNDKEFRVNIWDFGGQEIYHTTHQFFLTKRSLYVLVVDTRKEDTDFYYWLNVVELLSNSSPLIIIKNEKQERQREIDERQLRGEFNNLKLTLSTNFATKRGLPEILTQIKHYMESLPHVGTELPKTWIKVRRELENDPRDYISLNEYLDICKKNGFTSLDDKLQLSEYLHDLGVFLHFQEDNLLNKTIILKPTWGTDAVYKVLDNPKIIKNHGKFTWDDLKNIWHEKKYTLMQSELLQLMMNFKLCYEIPNFPRTYIAPQMLMINQPFYTWDKSNNLFLRYEYEFMPKGIITRFIVEMHYWIEQQSFTWKNNIIKQTLLWKSGVVLLKEDARAEIIEVYRYHKGEIRIRVSGKQPRDLLSTIRHELDKIHHSYNSSEDRLKKVQRLKYKTLVPCSCLTCKSSYNPHFYQLDNLHNFRSKYILQIQCQISGKMVNVGSLIDDVGFGKSQSSNDRELRLEELKDTIKSELRLRIEKLKTLRKELAIATDPNILFKLEKDIEMEEEKIANLENRLDEMW
jgi:internalin A